MVKDISGSGWTGTGWQQEEYLPTDVNQLPMEPAIGKKGEPVQVQGDVNRDSWRLHPSESAVPIGTTNGVHVPSWLAPRGTTIWEGIEQVDDAHLLDAGGVTRDAHRKGGQRRKRCATAPAYFSQTHLIPFLPLKKTCPAECRARKKAQNYNTLSAFASSGRSR